MLAGLNIIAYLKKKLKNLYSFLFFASILDYIEKKISSLMCKFKWYFYLSQVHIYLQTHFSIFPKHEKNFYCLTWLSSALYCQLLTPLLFNISYMQNPFAVLKYRNFWLYVIYITGMIEGKIIGTLKGNQPFFFVYIYITYISLLWKPLKPNFLYPLTNK